MVIKYFGGNQAQFSHLSQPVFMHFFISQKLLNADNTTRAKTLASTSPTNRS